jgi:hypothetical protein
MTRTLGVASFLLGLLCSHSALAEIAEIPLPGLLGTYPAARTASFQLRSEPLVIRGASIRLAGEATVGSSMCLWGGPYSLTLTFNAHMLDTPEGYWSAGGGAPEPGSFEFTSEFYPLIGNPTWEFLMDGSGQLTLYGSIGALLTDCWEVTSPTATVTEATLYVDAEFPVPTETTSWGRIKALYE